jgi:hypothetical protein
LTAKGAHRAIIEFPRRALSFRAEFGDDERHPLRHQPGYKGHVAGEPVELSDNNRTFAGLAGCEGRGELRSPLQGIDALAGLDLGELGDENVALRLGETGDGGPLRLNAEP